MNLIQTIIKMVELSEEIIDVMKKLKDALNETSFKINRFEVANTAAYGEMINIDIRRHKCLIFNNYRAFW